MKCYIERREYWHDHNPEPFDRPGVYMLVQRDTRRAYIGSSVNMKKRVTTHFVHLDGGNHPTRLMGIDYYRYGKARLVAVPLISALPDCTAQELLGLEIQAIQDRRPAYNKTHVPPSPSSKLPKYKAPKPEKPPRVSRAEVRYEGLTFAELEKKYGLGQQTLLARWKAGRRGASLVEPVDPNHYARILEYRGTRGTYAQWAAALGISVKTLKVRVSKYPLEKALKYISPPHDMLSPG